MQMIERVARAIEATKPMSDWPTKEEIDRQARAAIEAMREPTEEMVTAAGLAIANEISTDPWDCLSPIHEEALGFEIDGADAYEEASARLKVFGAPIFNTMIDAALQESKETGA